LTDIQAQVREETIVRLTDDNGAGAIDTDKVNAAIKAADDLIDGFLRGRYSVPLTGVPVPGIILNVSRDLAIYEIYSRRGEGGVTENVRARAQDARKLLLQIQKGEVTLGLAAPDAETSDPFQVSKESQDRLFGPETLGAF
jgi:phage gp36-like protein